MLMLPPFAIAVIFIVMLSMPQASGFAFYVCAALTFAYLGLTDSFTQPARSMAAGVLLVFFAVSTFAAPVSSRLVAVLQGKYVNSESYDLPSQKRLNDKADLTKGELVRVPIGRDGHYHVNTLVSQMPVRMMVDTGASITTLAYDDARRVIGPNLDRLLRFNVPVSTANGATSAAFASLGELKIGGIVFPGPDVLVARPGALAVSLLGMDILGRLTKLETRNGELVLYQVRRERGG